MLPAAAALRILLPAVSLIYVFYRHYRSGAKTAQDVSVPGDGNDVVARPPNSPASPPHPAPSDLDLAILDVIPKLDPAVLDDIRKLDPSLVEKFQKLDPAALDRIRRFDPAVVAAFGKLDPSTIRLLYLISISIPIPILDGFPPSSSPDPDPAPSDLDHAALDELQMLGLKKEKEEDVVDGFPKLDVKEEDGGEVEVEKGSDNWGGIENRNGGENEVQSDQRDAGGGGEDKSEDGGEEEKKTEESSRRYQYPVRPEAEDCSFYLKTGSCKFGSNCKFNHPVRRKTSEVSKDKVEEWEESTEKQGQTDCKYYLRPGGCKYGKACRYSHSKGEPSVAPVLELNFVGLPIRPGERECRYYMQNGSCKYALNCRFTHPGPTDTGRSDSPSGYGNGGPDSQSTVAPWSAPRSLNESPVYVPMMIPPSQNTEWNGFQEPAYLPQRSMPARPPYITNNSVTETNVYKQYPQQKQVEEFPERPGQPLCRYFLRTGDCEFKCNCKYDHPKTLTAVSPSFTLSDNGLPLRPAPAYLPGRSMPAPPPYAVNNSVTETVCERYPPQKQVEELPERPGQPVCIYFSNTGDCEFKSNCKYHHPKTQSAVPPPCPLNDKGLPLRPGLNICTHYSRYGSCNFGAACNFDHPSL